MDDAFAPRIRELFDATVELPVGQRESYLDTACAADPPELKEEVRALLRADENATDPFPPPGPWVGRQVGRYRLVRQLGQGGQGVVYEADIPDDPGERVAIKFLQIWSLDPTARSRFEREKRVLHRLSALRHPNTVRVRDCGATDDGIPYLVMDLLPGPDLKQLLRDRLPTPAEAVELLLPVVEAIAHAHSLKILHRDLKPGNVLLDGKGQPCVTDFGLARDLASDSTLTATGQTMGTIHYIAPEQASGATDAHTERTDVYGLGALLYFLLTRQPPHSGSNPHEVIDAVLERSPTPPRQLRPEIPSDLERICLKCLEREPADRYASAAALAEELRQYSGGGSLPARKSRPWWWPWTAVLGLAVLFV